MARFSFVSLNLVSHCDFGGHSFVRTARELRHRGHEVDWTLSGGFGADSTARTRALLEEYGLPIAADEHLLAGFDADAVGVTSSVERLAAELAGRRTDVAVVDRICVRAGLAAHNAGIPWANVGTDGRHWRIRTTPGPTRGELERGDFDDPLGERLLATFGANGFPESARRTYWGASPFLNLSFFTRSFFEEPGSEVPAVSHFLGGPVAASPPPDERDRYLLIALGNTFASYVADPLLFQLRAFLASYRVPTLIVGTSRALAAFDDAAFPHVTVRPWVPYDEAFDGALACVGHGGTCFLWHALSRGIPTLVVPSGIGDQRHNATRMEALGAPVLWPEAMRPARASGRTLESLLKELVEPPQAGAAGALAATMREEMRSGGGPRAAADLLERLAETGEPVDSCAPGACCC